MISEIKCGENMRVCRGTRPRKHLVFCLLKPFKWIFSSVQTSFCFCTQSGLLYGLDWFVFYFWLGMRNIESSVGATLLSRCHSIFSAKKFLCKICSNCRVYLRKEIKSGYDEPTLHFQNDAKNFFFHTCVKVILSVSILAELRGFQILQCLVLYLVSWRIWLPFIWNKSIYLVLPFHVFH